MSTLKTIVRRSTALGSAFALLAGAVVPAMPVYADALNPLTDRSLTLSSGSPGWAYTDGSGNSTYAPPNSGANGQKTGNTFDFKVSSTATVEGFSFQYCTTSAGYCQGPGTNTYGTGTGTISLTDTQTAVTGAGTDFTNELSVGSAIQTAGGNSYIVASIADGTNLTLETAATATEAGVAFDYRDADTTSTSDLNIVTDSPTKATFGTYVTNTDASQPAPTGNPDGMVSSVPAPATAGANFLVYWLDGTTWTDTTANWTMTASNNETAAGGDDVGSGDMTGKNNYITLTDATGDGFTAGDRIKIVFFATDSNYITNPGADEFFVKINTWNTNTPATWSPGNSENIDGGVTVANVMNESIQITTKVLETMDFSVGTVDPFTLESEGAGTPNSQLDLAYGGGGVHNVHIPCERIQKGMTPSDPANVLNMGNESAEFSLETDHTYSTHSYWRLSSNSSAGATVYYSGTTLSNTVGDQIDAIGATAAAPQEGAEQFGLALANGAIADNAQPWTPTQLGGAGGHMVDYVTERTGANVFEWGADNAANGLATPASGSYDASVTDDADSNLDDNASWHAPRLYPLIPLADYDGGAGVVNSEYDGGGGIDTSFAFDPASITIPAAIATQDSQVVDCVTGKMRYIANIAATTPAGIYTTKINYIAAPQY